MTFSYLFFKKLCVPDCWLAEPNSFVSHNMVYVQEQLKHAGYHEFSQRPHTSTIHGNLHALNYSW